MAVAIVFVVSYLLVVVLYYRVARRATRYSRRHLQGERLSQAGYRNSLEAYLSGSSMAIFHRTSGGSLPGLPSEPQNQTRDSFDLPAVKVPPWKPSSHEQDVKRATPGAGNSRERRHVMRDQGTGAEHASAAKMHQNAPRRSHPEKTPSHPPKKTSALMIPQLSKTSNDSRSAVFPKISLQRPSLESLGQHTLNLSILSTDSGQTVGTEKFKHHRSLGAAAKVSGSEYYATGTCKRYAPARQRRRGHAVARDPADASTAFARDPADASTAFARDPADASTISGHGAINEQGTTSGHSTVSGHRFELSSSLPRKDMRRSFVACTLTMATYLPYTLLLMASHTFSLPVGEENYVVAQWAVLLAASLNCFVYGYLNANYRMAASKLMGKARNRRRTIPQTTQKRSAETQIEIRGEIVEETVKD
ncbi:hypothetical protein BaRGS_00013600 [Batillaria attramentaria]|uniref:G-protein coupled receptors family 1 profile domain-containing protein n=1 Tax=Batillaria attramentaria TaxID=370345 RepID=A0ABD0L7R5_9CAEN